MPEAVVVAHAVLVGVEARQNVGVGREGQDVVGMGVREDAPLAGQTVEVRGRAARVAVETDRVVAQRVQGQEDDVPLAPKRRRRFLRRGLPRALPGAAGHPE